MFLLVYTDINANRCNDLPNNAPACNDRLEVSIMMENMEKVKDEAYKAAKEILEKAKLEKGDLFVVGCSTSEVCGETIGTHSKPELADMVFAGIYEATKEYGVYLVNVVPQPKAGGSFATAAYKNFKHPVAVEHIKAAAGMDIGDTLIGMHLQDVAVPTRIETKQIGNAHVVCARTRLKFIGGERAVYDHDLM